jgi:hypothetical protein
MGASQEGIYHLRGFEDLIYDAVHLLYLAHDVDVENDQDLYERTYIRTSILNTLLLFECGANCCLEALDLSGVLKNDLDKLPFLSKYEFFLSRRRPVAQFDRGSKEVQAVAELKKVRDDYVHPKVKKQRYSVDDDFDCGGPDFGHTTILKIPLDPRRWDTTHAVRSLKSANDFFNTFFLSWCGFDTDTVCELLLGSDSVSIPSKSSIGIDCTEGLSRAVREWGIDFKFIGKRIQSAS